MALDGGPKPPSASLPGQSTREPRIDPYLNERDLAVVHNLLYDINTAEQIGDAQLKTSHTSASYNDKHTAEQLAALKDEPTVFCSWDYKNLPLDKSIAGTILKSYIAWAQKIVRNPVDVVFLTHILLYMSTSVPSAVFLFYNFTWLHGILHIAMQAYYAGSFTLMLHNCIHQNGLLAKEYAVFDRIWPYVLEPLMGHTWDSYYYHHVKHHHVENNGPDDLSSTIRYQRDEPLQFAMYVGRFLLFVWAELPVYFFRKRKYMLGIKAGLSEQVSYALFLALGRLNFNATLFVLILPFCLMRIALMVGNFGQHALVDEIDPKSDFRSSITLIDVPTNRFCFNDGYHTSHHLNPLRHWQDHQAHFIKAKKEYQTGKALMFRNIDYFMMTFKILSKDYLYLADCMIPIGEEQIKMTRQERADLLRSKTRRFTEAEIQEKFYRKKAG